MLNLTANITGSARCTVRDKAANTLTHGTCYGRSHLPSRGVSTVKTLALFKNPFANKPASSQPVKPVRPTVIPEPAYNIPIVLLGLSALSAYEGATPVAGLLGLLGVFLGVQSTRVRFVFDDKALEVKVGEQLDESGPNAFVGGKNRWTYDSFVNWEFWWPGFPVLVYFKETQTKPEGQIHFFPVLFNGQQLYNVMLERCGSSQTSGPK